MSTPHGLYSILVFNVNTFVAIFRFNSNGKIKYKEIFVGKTIYFSE